MSVERKQSERRGCDCEPRANGKAPFHLSRPGALKIDSTQRTPDDENGRPWRAHFCGMHPQSNLGTTAVPHAQWAGVGGNRIPLASHFLVPFQGLKMERHRCPVTPLSTRHTTHYPSTVPAAAPKPRQQPQAHSSTPPPLPISLSQLPRRMHY
jgi:hypothetical protein